MDTFEAILTRRSIRDFKEEKISEEIIQDLLKAGMHAPSAYNQQAWQFVVVDDRKTLDHLADFHPHAKMCKSAPQAVLVCVDLSLEKSKDNWLFDCAAATQNIMLAARAKNIGSVWVGIYFNKDLKEEFQKTFHLPKNILPISLIPLGYPAKEALSVDRFKKDRIHKNKW